MLWMLYKNITLLDDLTISSQYVVNCYRLHTEYNSGDKQNYQNYQNNFVNIVDVLWFVIKEK